MKNKIIQFTVMITVLLSVSFMYSCNMLFKMVTDAREEYSSREYETDGTLTIDFVKSKFTQWTNSSAYNNIQTKKTLLPVRTAQELMAIGENVYTLSGVYYLANDIDISGVENWKPIGNKEDAFKGTLYGNGHIIYGLKINRNTQAHEQGLFGRTYFAEIRDLGVGVVSLRAGSAIGGIVGSADSGSQIVNVAVAPLTDTAIIEGSGGYIWKALPFLGKIPGGDAYGEGQTLYHALVGGLVGHAHLNTHVKGYNLGLPVQFSEPSGIYLLGFVGGLVGRNLGTVEGVSTADVTILHGAVGVVGGLVGINYESVTGVATGNVLAKGSYTGGFIGLNAGKAVGIATGDVSTSQGGIVNIGGFIGSNSGGVTGVSTGNVFAEDAGSAVGGFFGETDIDTSKVSVSGYTLSNVVFAGHNYTKNHQIGPVAGRDDDVFAGKNDTAYDHVYYFYQNDKEDGLVNRGRAISYNTYGVAVQHTGGAAGVTFDLVDQLSGLTEGTQAGTWTFWNGKWPMLNLSNDITSVLEVDIQDLVQEPATPGDFPDH